ncbi:unnamed protein product [Miscanthus lutarioriparius]|uniref:EF-hand domain-containing protein n=1 Tax=Miscanthus lutarioriparius TaxID=422564 RepID=A0A811SSE3_9POAL|nr:unnamed protein product [Miscanthus lutarioriparius]
MAFMRYRALPQGELTVEEFRAWLAQFDADRDGRISREELQHALRSLNVVRVVEGGTACAPPTPTATAACRGKTRWPASSPSRRGTSTSRSPSSATTDHLMIHRASPNKHRAIDRSRLREEPINLRDEVIQEHVVPEKDLESLMLGLRKLLNKDGLQFLCLCSVDGLGRICEPQLDHKNLPHLESRVGHPRLSS